MKKLIISFCVLLASLGAHAQFEKGKWIINPSITGLSLSHSNLEKTEFGIHSRVGAFVVDNVAVMVSLGAEWADLGDFYTVGAGGRYYFDKIGIYAGCDIQLERMKIKYSDSRTNVALTPEVGYAFFISRTVTIEPAVYYNLSLKDSDYSKYGLKIGFGLYF